MFNDPKRERLTISMLLAFPSESLAFASPNSGAPHNCVSKTFSADKITISMFWFLTRKIIVVPAFQPSGTPNVFCSYHSCHDSLRVQNQKAPKGWTRKALKFRLQHSPVCVRTPESWVHNPQSHRYQSSSERNLKLHTLYIRKSHNPCYDWKIA